MTTSTTRRRCSTAAMPMWVVQITEHELHAPFGRGCWHIEEQSRVLGSPTAECAMHFAVQGAQIEAGVPSSRAMRLESLRHAIATVKGAHVEPKASAS